MWTECSVVGIPPSPVTANAIFTNSYTGAGVAAGNWAIADLKPLGVPADAKAVVLAGILIITPGTGAQEPAMTSDLTVRFRKPGDIPANKYVSWGNYIGQVCDRNAGNGFQIGEGGRSTMAAIVPLENGCFEWGWDRSTYAQWPDSAAYGINLNVQAYFR